LAAAVVRELAHFAAMLPASVWRRLEFDGAGELAIASIFWRRGSWSRERRVVVLRKREMDELQGHLFDADGWSYTVVSGLFDRPDLQPLSPSGSIPKG
jgi:hypothetical protein